MNMHIKMFILLEDAPYEERGLSSIRQALYCLQRWNHFKETPWCPKNKKVHTVEVIVNYSDTDSYSDSYASSYCSDKEVVLGPVSRSVLWQEVRLEV